MPYVPVEHVDEKMVADVITWAFNVFEYSEAQLLVLAKQMFEGRVFLKCQMMRSGRVSLLQ
jgi:hypothetical protein